ncbi:hypothetical protein [Mucilaginibacter sp.]|uniref:hypothetical protein n=1 Tax=Mucilaginibacter sp. TaxID=1882438 RepID=UPI0025EFDEC6|nr:hypothetical protein [Mucilaginibacter sp.]
MAGLRDNFKSEVKRILGSRVAFRCCYPGCGVLTIGPNAVDDYKAIVLGEAAHIHAAASGGPRYLPEMTADERKSFDNGIWLCRHHAKLIDADFRSYSAETLLQWKQTMETDTYRQLKDLTKSSIHEPTTIICLHPQLMFEGIWKSAVNDTWRFVVKDFIFGDLNALREYGSSHKQVFGNYIIVESQGDGRLIHDSFEWANENGTLEIAVKVYPPVIRRDPNHIGGDLALGPDHDLVIENGDFKIISGKQLAKQLIESNLSITPVTLLMNPKVGSMFNIYYHAHKQNPILLNRIIKIELTRLITIPIRPEDPTDQPELNFINRIININVLDEVGNYVPVQISLEWGDGTFWSDTIQVFLSPQHNDEQKPIPEIIERILDMKPLEELRVLTSSLTGPELTIKQTPEITLRIFQELLPAIMDNASKALESEIFPLFNEHILYRSFDNNSYEYNTSYDLELHLYKRGLVHQLGITISLKGFKKAGIRAFDVMTDLFIYFNDYNYMIGYSKSKPWMTKLYNQRPSEDEIAKVADDFINNAIKQINQKILDLQ